MFNPLIDLPHTTSPVYLEAALRALDIIELRVFDVRETDVSQQKTGFPWRFSIGHHAPPNITNFYAFDFPTQNAALAAYTNIKHLVNQVEERNATQNFS